MLEDFNRFDEMFAEIDKDINKLVKATAVQVESLARIHSRERYGYMKEGWYVRTEDWSDYQTLSPPEPGYRQFPELPAPAHNEAMVAGSAEHTIYNEYGTWKMSAQPMVGPAVEQVRQNFLDGLDSLANGDFSGRVTGTISEYATI